MERSISAYNIILTKNRNKLTESNINSLNYIRFNSKLINNKNIEIEDVSEDVLLMEDEENELIDEDLNK